jgi:hypothetical protein
LPLPCHFSSALRRSGDGDDTTPTVSALTVFVLRRLNYRDEYSSLTLTQSGIGRDEKKINTKINSGSTYKQSSKQHGWLSEHAVVVGMGRACTCRRAYFVGESEYKEAYLSLSLNKCGLAGSRSTCLVVVAHIPGDAHEKIRRLHPRRRALGSPPNNLICSARPARKDITAPSIRRVRRTSTHPTIFLSH